MTLSLPDRISRIISTLEREGFEAYAVGGCVRDMIMDTPPHDYDICTSALPEDVKRIFADLDMFDAGIKHGTVTVISEGEPVEITAFRKESAYSDGRHPDSVSFSATLRQDLSRRDFTVNAMAFSESKGIVDLFGGMNDIKDKVIRCVGDPDKRFSEDALRIMRALRFSSVLGFAIEDNTARSALSHRESLNNISSERIQSELSRALCGDGIYSVLISFPQIICQIIPELNDTVGYDQNNPHHDFDLYTHISKTVASCPKDKNVRIAALLHDVGKPSTKSLDENGISHYFGHAALSAGMAAAILKRLKFSNSDISEIETLIRHHDGVIEETHQSVKRKMGKLGTEMFFKLIGLKRADNASQLINPDFRLDYYNSLCQIANKVISNSECLSVKSLEINGNDMIDLGYQGAEIGAILKEIFQKVLSDELANDRDTLLSYAITRRGK